MKFIFLFFCSFFIILINVNASENNKKTIYDDICWSSIPNLIHKKDPSNFKKLRNLGVKRKVIYWNEKEYDAFVFRGVYEKSHNIEFRVHTKFKTKARREAIKYAKMAGQIPNFLRRYMRVITIFEDPKAGGWYARANEIIVMAQHFQNTCAEEVLMHEAAHNTLDYWRSSGQIRKSKWQKAAKADEFYISNYAKEFPNREDIAETIVPWIAVRCKSERIKKADYKKITEGIPNRLKVLDESYLNDMRPMKCTDKRKKK